MNTGIWVWPQEEQAQKEAIRRVSGSPHLMAAMSALAKSKDGMSNAQLDDVLGDNSNWLTLWVIRQLTAIGFIEFKVDYFGGPARYSLTELGIKTLSIITGKPIPPGAQAPPVQQPLAAQAPKSPA